MAKKNNVPQYVTPSGKVVTGPSKLNKPKSPYEVFHFINGLVFIIVCLIILIPIWKILVDSLDLTTGSGMRLFPEKFGFDGYVSIFTDKSLLLPLGISFLTTLCGTFLGLTLSTIGAYVLIQ